MKTKSFRSVSVLVAGLAACGVATAADYDEAIDGDLLSLADGGTSFNLDVGTNSVTGTITANPAGGLEEDFVTFTIGAGEALTGVTLTNVVFTGGNTSTGFRLYTDQGTGFFQAASGSFGTADVGVNYLTVWNLDDVGGSAPLGPGTYGVLLAEFTPGQEYSFDITVVPTPGVAAVIGLGGLAAMRRRA
ncbi:MAG: hypothetical protein AAGI53_09915 [Planctomycetota bacterium]